MDLDLISRLGEQCSLAPAVCVEIFSLIDSRGPRIPNGNGGKWWCELARLFDILMACLFRIQTATLGWRLCRLAARALTR